MLASIVGTVLTVLEPEKDERLIYAGRMRATCTKEQLTAKGTPSSGMADISREDEERAPVTLFPSLIQLEPLVGLLIFLVNFHRFVAEKYIFPFPLQFPVCVPLGKLMFHRIDII